MSDIWQRDAEDAAAAMETMNEQTAEFQAWEKKRPTVDEIWAKSKPSGYYEPGRTQSKKPDKQKEWWE
jgi:hypothetical protein